MKKEADILTVLFGGHVAVRVLAFLQAREEGYQGEIAHTFGISASMVQKQLEKFSECGVIKSVKFGDPKTSKTKMFSLNDENEYVPFIRPMLAHYLESLPAKERKLYEGTVEMFVPASKKKSA